MTFKTDEMGRIPGVHGPREQPVTENNDVLTDAEKETLDYMRDIANSLGYESVLAARFDSTFGEWICGVVASWQPLPPPPVEDETP